MESDPAALEAFDFRLLTDSQMRCLVCVAEGHTSKEIARILKVSRHTVDERMRNIMAMMKVSSRRHCGFLLRQNAHWHEYQALIYQSPHLSSETISALTIPSANGRQSFALEEDREATDRQLIFERILNFVPFPTRNREVNGLSIPARLALIGIIAVFAALAFGSLVGAISAVSNMMRT